MHPTLHQAGSTVVLIIDIQERLVAAMNHSIGTRATTARLIRIAHRLSVPLLVTEQYPKGLGKTVADISEELAEHTPVFEKTAFSCFGCPAVAAEIDRHRPETVVLAGMEAHVCIQQTALDALSRGFHVVLPADAVLSRHAADLETAIELLRHRGVTVTTVEALAFALLRDSAHEAFKEVSKIVLGR